MTTVRFVPVAIKREKRVMARFNILAAAISVAVIATPCVSALAAETIGAVPARVEATTDAKIKKITLTPKAAERLVGLRQRRAADIRARAGGDRHHQGRQRVPNRRAAGRDQGACGRSATSLRDRGEGRSLASFVLHNGCGLSGV
jgi:hypothetical protein